MRTQQRIELSEKPLISIVKRNTMVRYVGNPRGVLSIHVSLWALSGASLESEFESAPRSFVQTGDILNTERNAARVLFCKRR